MAFLRVDMPLKRHAGSHDEHVQTRTPQGQRVPEPQTAAEGEKALAQALVDLKAATEVRRRLPARSPDLVEAVRQEREVMEHIRRLIVLLGRDQD